MQSPKFLYFDLGNVLLYFDHHLAARQMAEVAGLTEDQVWRVVFEGDLESRYEAGELDDRQFYEAFCQVTKSSPDFEKFLFAGSAIFRPNLSIVPVVVRWTRPDTGWECCRTPARRTGRIAPMDDFRC